VSSELFPRFPFPVPFPFPFPLMILCQRHVRSFRLFRPT
jgi:hypothetical protein